MIVYLVDSRDGGVYFATLRAARAHAHHCTPEDGYPVVIERITLIPMNKAGIIGLLNAMGGYVETSRVIARFEAVDEDGAA